MRQFWYFQRVTQNNTTHFVSEFISNNTETFREIPPHKTLFVRVHIKQYWHFRRVTTKQYYLHSPEFISHNTLSGSNYEIILHIFSEFMSNNTETFREILPHKILFVWVHIKQY